MSTSTAPSVRCPACTAYVRAGSEWCTLCYADLRPKPDPAPPVSQEPSSEALAEVEHVGAAMADLPAPAAPTPRGKHAKRAAAESVFGQPTAVVDDAEVGAIADRMLAELASQRENPLGPLSTAVDTKAKQVALMVGGAFAGMFLLFVLMALLGTLL